MVFLRHTVITNGSISSALVIMEAGKAIISTTIREGSDYPLPNRTIRSIPSPCPWSQHLQPARQPREISPLKRKHATMQSPLGNRESAERADAKYTDNPEDYLNRLEVNFRIQKNATEPCCTSVTWPPRLLRIHEATIPIVEPLGGTVSAEYGPRSSNQIFI